MSDLERKSMIEVNSFQELPNFKNEDEEAEFWANHSLGDQILEQMENLNDSLLIEDAVLARLRQLPMDKQQEVLDFANFLYQKVISK